MAINDFRSKSEYVKFHKILNRQRGAASSFECVACGIQAKDWAHCLGTNPRDMRNYNPMCRRCHKLQDCNTKEHKAKMSAALLGNKNAIGNQGWKIREANRVKP